MSLGGGGRGGAGGGGSSTPVCWANKASREIFASQSGNIGLIERLRYPVSDSQVRVSPFCLAIFADVSIFTSNFYPFPRGKPRSTRKRQTGTGVFCLLYVGRLNSKNFQHLTQINNAHMLVKVFNNLWRT